MNLRVLASGSSGNCSLVFTDQCRLLVDAGISASQISERLNSIGVNPKNLDGILITHEHTDHVKGLESFVNKFHTPVYINANTACALFENKWNLFEPGSSFTIQDIEVQNFYVPHDAIDPSAFTFSAGGKSLAIVTDLGYVPRLVLERVKHVNTLMIEANHDVEMLHESDRSWRLKQRIRSRRGHLSNDDSATLAAAISGNGLNRVILAHLSSECNEPYLAISAMHSHGLENMETYCADNTVSPEFKI